MMTRAERSARNKAAHAARRRMTDADYATARADGLELSWRQIWDTYAGMDVDTVLELEGTPAAPAPVLEPVKAKRAAPAHIVAAQAEFALAREVWQAGLDAAIAGGRSTAAGGRPARGERYTDEERDYRDANPAPVWRAVLEDMRGRNQDVNA